MEGSSEILAERLRRIGAILRQTAPLWRPAPFHHPIIPWASDFPKLHAALLALPDAQVEALHADTAALRRWLDPYLPGMAGLEPLLQFERRGASATGIGAISPFPARDVPGRKWAQIASFAAVAREVSLDAEVILDWCSGKAHLGRLLGLETGLPVHALERDAALCHEAERLAKRDGVRLTAQVCDVLRDPLDLPSTALACALHACGDLHLTLLDRAAQTPPAGLLLAPCCYHRTRHAVHVPRSSVGRACHLHLTREDLRLAVLETVTAGKAQREAEQRRKVLLLALKAWGEGQGRQLTDYAALKDLGRKQAGCPLQNACARLGWPHPSAAQAEELLHWGTQRAREVRALELIRAAIRRPLEVWLALDMALGMHEADFDVEVGEFCGHELTPRNLLIRARRVMGLSRPASPAVGDAPRSARDSPSGHTPPTG